MEGGHFRDDEAHLGRSFATGNEEVGHGCLAGPVVIAAVTGSPVAVARADGDPLLADSKKLTAERQLAVYPRLRETAERVRIAVVGTSLIDHLNIPWAILHGVALTAPPNCADGFLLIDGCVRPVSRAETLVEGDVCVAVIVAVIAEVCRDVLPTRFADDLPDYGFAAHKRLCHGNPSPRSGNTRPRPSAPRELSTGPGSGAGRERRGCHSDHRTLDSLEPPLAGVLCRQPSLLPRCCATHPRGLSARRGWVPDSSL